MNIRIIILIFCFIGITSIANADESSSIDPIEVIEEGPSKGWRIFIKSFGDEAFEIRFPKKPMVVQNKNDITYTCTDASNFPIAVYALSFHEQLENPDAATIFQNRLASFAEGPNVLVAYEISTTDQGETLDLVSTNFKTRVISKERIVVTKSDVYSLNSMAFISGVDNHNFFVESFRLLTK